MFWTIYHVYTVIPALIIELIGAFFIGKALKGKSEKIRLIPIQVITIILLVLEVAKQLYGLITGYDLYSIPLHYCSLFLFIFPFVSFYKGKHKDIFRCLGAVISACLFLFMTIYPNLIYPAEDVINCGNFLAFKTSYFLGFHTVFFHCIAMASFPLFLVLDLFEFNLKRDLLSVLAWFAGYCIIVAPISHIIKVNFNNFYHCNNAALENFRLSMIDKIGWVGQLIYVLMISIGTIIVPILAYFLFKGCKILIDKTLFKKPQIEENN